VALSYSELLAALVKLLTGVSVNRLAN